MGSTTVPEQHCFSERPFATLMRSPGGKSERGDNGGKGVGSSASDEETEDGSTVCT